MSAAWVDAGHGYEGAESALKLDGWTRSRRVIVTRRLIKDNIILTDDKQLNLAFIDYGVARQIKHAGQTKVTITNNHAKSSVVIAVLQELNKFLKYLKTNAEQLQVAQRMGLIVKKAFHNLLAKASSPPLIPAPV